MPPGAIVDLRREITEVWDAFPAMLVREIGQLLAARCADLSGGDSAHLGALPPAEHVSLTGEAVLENASSYLRALVEAAFVVGKETTVLQSLCDNVPVAVQAFISSATASSCSSPGESRGSRCTTTTCRSAPSTSG